MKPRDTDGNRWNVWAWKDIVVDGVVQIRRLRVIQTPLGGIFVHNILEPDPDRELHDHPWSFVSLVLRGGYAEVLSQVRFGEVYVVKHLRWHSEKSIHFMRAEQPHRIARVEPNTWTLLLVGRRRREWGFHMADGTWQFWKRYHEQRPGKFGAA